MAAPEAATAYYADMQTLSRQVSWLLLRRWRRVSPDDIAGSWERALPEVAAIAAAGQTVAAQFAEPYLNAIVPATFAGYAVDPGGFTGLAPESVPVPSLLFQPATHALHDIGQGAGVLTALRSGASDLMMYAQTLIADAGRQSVAAGMGSRPHVSGYYRMLTPPSCSRCAILAGKHFAYNDGFLRHPRCDCVHIPAREADDSLLFDARKAIDAGKVTGLSKADLRAIDLGADPAQVVNARKGMYTVRGGKYTTTGTTRHGVAGARLLARDVARAQGGIEAVAGRTFDNLTFDRHLALKYQELLQHGKKFTRLTATGREQVYSYRIARSRRLMPEQILADAPSREEAIRLLINNGYILDAKATRAVSRVTRVRPSTALGGAARTDAEAAGAGLQIRDELVAARRIRAVGDVLADGLRTSTGREVFVDLAGLGVETAREYAEGILRCAQLFPEVRISKIVARHDFPGTYAYVDRTVDKLSFISFDTTFGSAAGRTRLLETLARDVGEGWTVRNSASPMSVAIHEFGHIVDFGTLRGTAHADIKRLVADEAKVRGMPADRLIRQEVSDYATKDTDELTAEAFLDVLLNGAAASPLSRSIFDLVVLRYREAVA